MIQISDDEFIKYVIDMAEGKKTQQQVIKELATEARTLNARIQKLSITNPEVYEAYIKRHSYKPKARKDINAIELAFEILKCEKTIEQIAAEHNCGIRTVSRRIRSLKDSENELEREVYRLCKIVTDSNKSGANIPPTAQEEIEKMRITLKDLLSETTTRGDNIELKRQELLAIEREYNKLCETMSKTQAARKMGYTTNRIYKLLNELYRIEIERKTKQSSADKRAAFYDSIKVDEKPVVQADSSRTDSTQRNIGIGKEKE